MLNHEKGESEEDLNLDNEDKLSEEELDKELSDLGDEDDDVLSYIQKETNKVFKSKEDLVKTLRQMDVDFAQGKIKKTQEQNNTQPKIDSSISERLLVIEQPDSQHVIEMIKRDHPGKDPYVVWNESEFYRNEAKMRAAKKLAETRMKTPSGEPGGEPKTEDQVIEDKWMNRPLPPGFAYKK